MFGRKKSVKFDDEQVKELRSASKSSFKRGISGGRNISRERSASRDKPKSGKISAEAFNLLKVSPTRELYEAKFENYRHNRDMKESHKEKLHKM